MTDKHPSSTEEPPLPMRMPLDIGPIDHHRAHHLDVSTYWHTDGLIEQTINIAGIQTTRIMNTAEQQIRAALIALGWTPPAEEKEPK